MTLIKTSILTTLSTIIKVITAFILNKVVAVYVGPSGLAIIGQLQNFISIMMTFSNGAITQGIVKYTAEYREDISSKSKFFSTAIVITFVSSTLTGFALYLFSNFLSEVILNSIDYESVFIIFAFTIILFSFNTLFMSILNGQKEIKKYVLINIISSIFSLILTCILIIKFSLIGALYAMVLNQSIIFFITLFFIIKAPWFRFEYFKQGIDKKSFNKLSKYSLMAIVSILAVPLSHLFIRNYIGDNLSWDDAGYWQGIWYISGIYLMIVTTSLNIYYLPKLSEITDTAQLKGEIINGYKIIIPIVSIFALGVFILRNYIIEIAFTPNFVSMLELFKWQLIGDVIKISSWLLSMIMIAKAMTKLFILTEIIFSISFMILSILGLNYFGLVGVTYAFSLNYFIYLFVMIFIFKGKFQ